MLFVQSCARSSCRGKPSVLFLSLYDHLTNDSCIIDDVAANVVGIRAYVRTPVVRSTSFPEPSLTHGRMFSSLVDHLHTLLYGLFCTPAVLPVIERWYGLHIREILKDDYFQKCVYAVSRV